MEMVYGLISKGMEEYCNSLWLQPSMVQLSTAGFHCWVQYPRDFSFSILISKMWIIEQRNPVLWAVTLSVSHLSRFKHSWQEASNVKHKCKGSWVQKIFKDLLQDGWKHERVLRSFNWYNEFFHVPQNLVSGHEHAYRASEVRTACWRDWIGGESKSGQRQVCSGIMDDSLGNRVHGKPGDTSSRPSSAVVC